MRSDYAFHADDRHGAFRSRRRQSEEEDAKPVATPKRKGLKFALDDPQDGFRLDGGKVSVGRRGSNLASLPEGQGGQEGQSERGGRKGGRGEEARAADTIQQSVDRALGIPPAAAPAAPAPTAASAAFAPSVGPRRSVEAALSDALAEDFYEMDAQVGAR